MLIEKTKAWMLALSIIMGLVGATPYTVSDSGVEI